jgi:hypothetical protein
MARTVVIKLESCELCPHLHKERIYTSDSWENVTGWYCKLSDKRKIIEYDWNDKPIKYIPKWCMIAEDGLESWQRVIRENF